MRQSVHTHKHFWVKADIAEQHGREAFQRLLEQRKLCLILDVDHTLLHTTGTPGLFWDLQQQLISEGVVPPVSRTDAEKESRLHLLRVGPCNSYVKLRPHLFRFLAEASTLFECHLYTLGSRDYAHALLPLLDPSGTIFEARVISAEDYDAKVVRQADGKAFYRKELSRIFPYSTDHCIIVDDTVDVWYRFSPTALPLLCIPRYYYFNVSTLPSDGQSLPIDNDAHLLTKLDILTDIHRLFFTNHCSSPTSAPVSNGEFDDEAAATSPPTAPHPKRLPLKRKLPRPAAAPSPVSEEGPAAATEATTDAAAVAGSPEACASEVPTTANGHPSAGLPFIRPCITTLQVIDRLKRRVFKGCIFLFSGVIPHHIPLQQSEEWRLTMEHGGRCCRDLHPRVTHVIHRLGHNTEKVKRALQNRTCFVIALDWFVTCLAQLRRLPEDPFLHQHSGHPGPDAGSCTLEVGDAFIDVDQGETSEDAEASDASSGEPSTAMEPGNCSFPAAMAQPVSVDLTNKLAHPLPPDPCDAPPMPPCTAPHELPTRMPDVAEPALPPSPPESNSGSSDDDLLEAADEYFDIPLPD